MAACSRHGPPDPSLLPRREDYLDSPQPLLALDADILCEEHFAILPRKRAVTNFIRQFMR